MSKSEFLTFALVFIFIILLILFGEYGYLLQENAWLPNDYARITNLDYKAVLVDKPGSKGKVEITEKITFDVHSAFASNPFWELWRDLPESYIDGVKVSYDVKSVKETTNGSTIIYPEAPKLYWYDNDYVDTARGLGPNKWYHSPGPYDEDNDLYECVFFYIDGVFRKVLNYELKYDMYNAALRYNDCSELYLCMFSEDSVNYLESFKGQILIPNNDMPSSSNYTAHTYGTNAHYFPFTESTDINPGYHTFLFKLDKSDLKFQPSTEYIEFSLVSFGDDKHKFTDYASKNLYYDDNVLNEIKFEQKIYELTPIIFFIIKIIVFVGSVLLSIIILKKSTKIKEKLKEHYVFYEPDMKFDYFREIPSDLDPNFAATLAFCKEKRQKQVIQDGYSALMLSLVRKDYLELERINPNRGWTNNNVKIIIKSRQVQLHPDLAAIQSTITDIIDDQIEFREPLTEGEKLYYNLIYRHAKGNEISMNDFQRQISQDMSNTDAFVKNIDNSIINIGISQKYFQRSSYTIAKHELDTKAIIYIILGFLILILGNLISYQTYLNLAFGSFFILGGSLILSAAHIFRVARKCILLTQFGENEYEKWHGLYKFLDSETLMNERTVIELPLWEKYLVYATAFGISEKVIKALQIRCPDMDVSPMLSNSYYRSHNFYSTHRSIRTTARSTSIHFSSGGYGGHGGYGGGGRGGGGGGGGH